MSNNTGGWWSDQGHVKMPPEGQLSDALRWIINQIHLGFFECLADDEGKGETLILGRATASDPDFDSATEFFKRRHLVLNIVGIFAHARERGTLPESVEGAEEVRFAADENGYANTEIHYALELMDVLKGIRERTFKLVNLPISGHASRKLIALLQEATRSHLYGLHTASVALCRALMEQALVERLPEEELEKETARWTARGELENRINAAKRLGLLDSYLANIAHGIRIRANQVLHGQATADDSFITLSDTRTIVEQLFVQKARA